LILDKLRRPCCLKGAGAPEFRIASPSPRARGTPGPLWTRGLRSLARTKRDNARSTRHPYFRTTSPPFLRRPARSVWGLLRETPGGLTFQNPSALRAFDGAYPPLLGGDGPRPGMTPGGGAPPYLPSEPQPATRDPTAWAATSGVRVAPCRSHRHPPPQPWRLM